MAKITDAQMKENAKMEVFGGLTEILEKMGAEQAAKAAKFQKITEKNSRIWNEKKAAKAAKFQKISEENYRIWKEEEARKASEKTENT